MKTSQLPTPDSQLPDLTYEPLDTVPATQHQQRNRPLKSCRQVECPYCGKLREPGAIVEETTPTWSMHHECLVVTRSTYCDHCSKRLVWLEQVIGKTPTGVILAGPFSTSGAKHLADYLSAHPQAQGVEQC